jgi:hypothetical protein
LWQPPCCAALQCQRRRQRRAFVPSFTASRVASRAPSMPRMSEPRRANGSSFLRPSLHAQIRHSRSAARASRAWRERESLPTIRRLPNSASNAPTRPSLRRRPSHRVPHQQKFRRRSGHERALHLARGIDLLSLANEVIELCLGLLQSRHTKPAGTDRTRLDAPVVPFAWRRCGRSRREA